MVGPTRPTGLSAGRICGLLGQAHQQALRLVDRLLRWERRCHIRGQNDDVAALGIPRRVLTSHAAFKIIVRQHLGLLLFNHLARGVAGRALIGGIVSSRSKCATTNNR